MKDTKKNRRRLNFLFQYLRILLIYFLDRINWLYTSRFQGSDCKTDPRTSEGKWNILLLQKQNINTGDMLEIKGPKKSCPSPMQSRTLNTIIGSIQNQNIF